MLEFSRYRAWPGAQAESDALLDALASLPLLHTLRLSPTSPSVLARMLSWPGLKALSMSSGVLWSSAESTALFCDALRANTQLESLSLQRVNFWLDMGAASAMLTSLVQANSLHELGLDSNRVLPEHAAAAGALLGTLVAQLHTLEVLDLDGCHLGDAGLGPFMDALPQSHRLTELYIHDNDMSEAFARERLLPAVRACAPLRLLAAQDSPSVRKAAGIAKRRG